MKTCIWISLFFAACVAVGLGIGVLSLHRGDSMGVAIFNGAYSGFLVAWVPLFLGYRAIRSIKRFSRK